MEYQETPKVLTIRSGLINSEDFFVERITESGVKDVRETINAIEYIDLNLDNIDMYINEYYEIVNCLTRIKKRLRG